MEEGEAGEGCLDPTPAAEEGAARENVGGESFHAERTPVDHQGNRGRGLARSNRGRLSHSSLREEGNRGHPQPPVWCGEAGSGRLLAQRKLCQRGRVLDNWKPCFSDLAKFRLPRGPSTWARGEADGAE